MASPTQAAAKMDTGVRQVIAPLTTQFEMPPGCETATFRQAIVTDGSLWDSCTAYQTSEMQCQAGAFTGSMSCFPHVSAFSDIGDGYFYSPGLHCPSDWVTAMTLTSGQEAGKPSIGAVRMDTLLSGETAALCCPSGFTYTSSEYDSTSLVGQCFRYVTTNDWFHECISTEEVPVAVREFGKPTSGTSYKTSGTSYSVVNVTVPYGGMIVVAPTIQLNYRAQDVSSSASVPASTAANEAKNSHKAGSASSLSGGAIAGAVVGVVAFLVAIGIGIFIIRKWRNKNKVDAEAQGRPKDAPEATDVNVDTPDNNGKAYDKPELAGSKVPEDRSHYPEMHGEQEQKLQYQVEHPVELLGDTNLAEMDGRSAPQELR